MAIANALNSTESSRRTVSFQKYLAVERASMTPISISMAHDDDLDFQPRIAEPPINLIQRATQEQKTMIICLN